MRKSPYPLVLGLLLAAAGLAAGCRSPGSGEAAAAAAPRIETDVYRRAEVGRSEFFEREVERLRADLEQAEASIVALESGLRGFRSRADAVSTVAEARIALERVAPSVPWRHERVEEADAKLREARRQLEAGHVGAAVFFASRAQRIADSLREEARQVALWGERRLIDARRARLRAGPSTSHPVVATLPRDTPIFPERTLEGWTLVVTPDGRVGWIHASLLTAP